MNARLRSAVLLATLALSLPALAAGDDAVTKPVKTVVQSVRYSKDEIALKQLAGEQQGRFLLGDDWAKGTDAQRKEFVELFYRLFSKIAFPKVRDNFTHLKSVTYEPAQVQGDTASVASTIVLEHPLKKQELKLVYALVKEKADWKVLDVKVLGDSMLTGIRDDQVRPIYKEGGWEQLLKLMREKDAELSKAAPAKAATPTK